MAHPRSRPLARAKTRSPAARAGPARQKYGAVAAGTTVPHRQRQGGQASRVSDRVPRPSRQKPARRPGPVDQARYGRPASRTRLPGGVALAGHFPPIRAAIDRKTAPHLAPASPPVRVIRRSTSACWSCRSRKAHRARQFARGATVAPARSPKSVLHRSGNSRQLQAGLAQECHRTESGASLQASQRQDAARISLCFST